MFFYFSKWVCNHIANECSLIVPRTLCDPAVFSEPGIPGLIGFPLFSTEVITITFISPWIPPSDDHVQILSKLADDGDADSALYQSKSNVLQELILCLRSYISTCLQLGGAWDLSIKQFPGTPFSYTNTKQCREKHRWSLLSLKYFSFRFTLRFKAKYLAGLR